MNIRGSHAPWELAYQGTGALWSSRPNCALVEYSALVPSGPVLDLGIGEGRNAFFFAQQGRMVEGIDIAPTAIQRVTARALENNVTVRACIGDIRTFDIPQKTYALIIADMVLQFCTWDDCLHIGPRIIDGLRSGGMVFFCAFAKAEARERALRKRQVANDSETSTLSIIEPAHFFSRAEVQTVFAALSLLCVYEGRFLDCSHGAPHYHNHVTYIGQKA